MEKERLLLCISRYDHYYDSVNNKSNVFLVLSTFIVGGLIAAYSPLVEKVACNFWINGIFFLLIAIGISIMLIVLRASAPFIKNKSKSLIFFGTISTKSFKEFAERSKGRSDKEEMDDLRHQVHQLSVGLKSKFLKLQYASWLFIAQFIIFIPFIILVFLNLK
jgi:hypothetical protein